MYISSFTPTIEPGMLPQANAKTTFRRTVSFFKCIRLAGILVKKLNSASEPTATIAGTRKPKISTGSNNTPPPTPLIPIKTPTTKPTRILSASSDMFSPVLLRCGSVYSDEALALQVQNNFLGGFFGRQLASVNCHFRIWRNFVGIGDPGEFLEDASSCFGIQALAVALLADLDRGCDVNQDEATVRFDHLTHVFPRGIVWSNGSTDGDAAVLGNLRSYVSDAPDVDVAVLF